jgi:hypothetical protein
LRRAAETYWDADGVVRARHDEVREDLATAHEEASVSGEQQLVHARVEFRECLEDAVAGVHRQEAIVRAGRDQGGVGRQRDLPREPLDVDGALRLAPQLHVGHLAGARERVHRVFAHDRGDLLLRKRRVRLLSRRAVGVRSDADRERTFRGGRRVRADQLRGIDRFTRVPVRTRGQREHLLRRRCGLDRHAAVDRRPQRGIRGQHRRELAKTCPPALDTRENARERSGVAYIRVRERIAREIGEAVGEGDQPVMDRANGLDRRCNDLRRVGFDESRL